MSLTPEDRERLHSIWTELRSFARRGRPEYIGQKLTFNTWLAALAAERGTQVGRDLARAAAASISGTVEESMPTSSPKTKTTKPAQTPQPAAPPKKRGRPPGRGTKTRGRYNFSLPLDLIEWAKNHPDGPAAVGERALRREQQREMKRSK